MINAETYERIARDLRDMLDDGVFAPGDKLPKGKVLAQEYDCTEKTAYRAIGVLQREGRVLSIRGKGTYALGIQTAGRNEIAKAITLNSMTAKMHHDLLNWVAARDLSEGYRLPPVSDLAYTFGVTRQAAYYVLTRLKGAGVITNPKYGEWRVVAGGALVARDALRSP